MKSPAGSSSGSGLTDLVHDYFDAVGYAFRTRSLKDVALHRFVIGSAVCVVAAGMLVFGAVADGEPLITLLLCLPLLALAFASCLYVVSRYRRRDEPDDVLERSVNAVLDKVEEARERRRSRRG